jgi:hypothetical protein
LLIGQKNISSRCKRQVDPSIHEGRPVPDNLFPTSCQPPNIKPPNPRLVHRWVQSIGLDSASYGTQSMQRTKAFEIFRKAGNLRAVRLLLRHTKLESTVGYLGLRSMTF